MSTVRFDGETLIRLVSGGAANLQANAGVVNNLNVFPIPDGDTGQNMTLTLLGGLRGLEGMQSGPVDQAARRLADGALLSARGNSGVILSQLFAGFADGLAGLETASLPELAQALRQGVRAAYGAVVTPTEGTILTVAREAAEYAAQRAGAGSTLLDREALEQFVHKVRQVPCGGCQNHCSLTVNQFSGGRRFLAGNRCSKPLHTARTGPRYDLYADKLELLDAFRSGEMDPGKKTIGLPMGLNFYDLLPFWHTFFARMGFNVLVSPHSDRALYHAGQHTIPSDTVCYPAKLMHGHIQWLLERKPDAIFYPDMSYNVDEGLGVDHFNCPVVAYYPQVLKLNVPELREVPFLCGFVSLADRKLFEKRIREILLPQFPALTQKQVHEASKAAYEALEAFRAAVRVRGEAIRAAARKEGKPVIVLCGRPYHVDPEVNHGMDQRICDLGAAVITEDCLSGLVEPFPTKVRNQWTYHSRMYAAAEYIARAPAEEDLHLVQLVSFGCGVDAITTDEVRSILEEAGRDYTQLKIDEISNMGAATIRLRSLLAMLEEKRRRSV